MPMQSCILRTFFFLHFSSQNMVRMCSILLVAFALHVHVYGQVQDAKAAKSEDAVSSYHDGKNYDERSAQVLKYCATTKPSNELEPKAAMVFYVARILTNQDTDYALNRWQAAAEAVYTKAKNDPADGHLLDPFFKHALVHSWLICEDKTKLPPEIIAATKGFVSLYRHKEWKGYGALNYRLMNDGSGYLAAERWADLVDTDGLNAQQIQAATKARLMSYFDEIVHENNGEWGAPTYLGINLAAMKMIADYAIDPEVKNHATLALDTMLLHVACSWNQGYYVTPASRSKYFGTSMTSPDAMDTTGAICWMYWGAHRPVAARSLNNPGSMWMVCKRTYMPPEIFAKIATDRKASYIHQGSATDKVRFTILHTPTYSIASQWEVMPNPASGHYKESRRNMFKWISDKPQSTFTPMQDNPRRPYNLKENVSNAFGYGENPFTQSMQHEATVISITNVPKDYPYWKTYATFTTTGAIVERIEKDNWVFCHGGSVLFAFRTIQPATWGKHREKENCDVLNSDDRTNGWVLQTSPVTPFAGGGVKAELDRFANAILTKTKLDTSHFNQSTPRFSYTALDGHVLDITYRGHKEKYVDQHKIDGKPIDYSKFPLLGNQWVQQPLGGDILTIKYGSQSLVYDFKNWTRTGDIK